MHIAVLNPHIEIIKFLLDQEGINANEVDEVLHINYIQFLFSIHDFFFKNLCKKPVELTKDPKIIELFK